MKYLNLIAMFLNLGLASASPQELPSGMEGNVKYYVSDPSQEVYVELPAIARLTIVDTDASLGADRFLVTLKLEYNADLTRPEIVKLRSRYPGYKLVEATSQIRLQKHRVLLSTNPEIVMEATPSSQVQLYGMVTMGLKQADALISRLKKGIRPTIELEVSSPHPVLDVREQLVLPLDEVCADVQSNSKFSDALTVLIASLSKNLSGVKSAKIKTAATEQALGSCLELVDPLAPPVSLQKILNTKVVKRLSAGAEITLYDADVLFDVRDRDMPVDFQWEQR